MARFRFRDIKTLQKFASADASICNHLNHDRHLNSRDGFKLNRAAALAIHGYLCKACDLDMGLRYGPAAAGLIEVHHVTPVSASGPGYIIDPKSDLVPLCPNCHFV